MYQNTTSFLTMLISLGWAMQLVIWPLSLTKELHPSSIFNSCYIWCPMKIKVGGSEFLIFRIVIQIMPSRGLQDCRLYQGSRFFCLRTGTNWELMRFRMRMVNWKNFNVCKRASVLKKITNVDCFYGTKSACVETDERNPCKEQSQQGIQECFWQMKKLKHQEWAIHRKKSTAQTRLASSSELISTFSMDGECLLLICVASLEGIISRRHGYKKGF